MKNGKSEKNDGGIEPVKITIGGKARVFDIDDPALPDWVENNKLTAGGYPYDKRMNKDEYEKTLERLQEELVKLQTWQQATGERVMVLMEGRDAAGKGGTIWRMHRYMNPRNARVVALPKPTETERGQWYFQRYIAHFPTAGEFVTFDRSWYNRAGVEPVMGFCTPEQHEKFLNDAPKFEMALVSEGIRFFKFWLNIGQETQLERFHDRRHSKLTHWKFSPIDIAGMSKWDDYTAKRDLMLSRTHTPYAPWQVVRANDKRRLRLEVIRHILLAIPYAGRDKKRIGKPDSAIIMDAPTFLGAR
ncbi:MAG: polyphosphate kinase 2 [Rhizobiaceae bacterium]|nr:polyphosphate kinase 2 [Rhizobiaceae bacterium]